MRIDVVFWKLAIGNHFGLVDKWLLQREIFFDTSPVDSKNHTPDMPFDRRIRYPTEVQYNWSDRLSTGGQFVSAEYGMVKIDNYLLKGDSTK